MGTIGFILCPHLKGSMEGSVCVITNDLIKNMEELREKYGNLEALHRLSSSPQDLERRLQEFRGVGPVCVNIFLRELRGIWGKAEPKPSKIAMNLARELGVEDVESYESALVRLSIEYCKKRRCEECPIREYCREKK